MAGYNSTAKEAGKFYGLKMEVMRPLKEDVIMGKFENGNPLTVCLSID